MTHHLLRTTLSVTLAACLCAATAPIAAHAETTPACTRYASPTGSDAAAGTPAAPVRSIAKLIALLGPGEHGCLPVGSTFVEPIGSFIVDNAGGAPGSPAVVRTADPDGEPAQIKGAMWLKPGVHDLTFDRVRFTDSPGNTNKATMLVVHGDRITFRRTEMTWSRGICLNAGNREGYVAGDTAATVAAEDLVIERSRIHDCGTDPAVVASLRAAGQSGVHGLYLVDAPRAIIRDNLVYDNIDRGIQLWPDVDDALIEHNLIDGNGSNLNIGSSAGYGHYSERTTVRNNVISSAVLRSVYDQPWGPGDSESIVGNFPADGSTHGNALTANCVWQPVATQAFGGNGYTHTGDVLGDPRYVSRATHDFTLRADSPCIGKGPRASVLDVPGTPTTHPDPQPADPVPPVPPPPPPPVVPPPPPPPVVPPAPATPSCHGRPASLAGTAGNDALTGTPGDDVIVGGGGDDRIQGLGGNDIVCGGEGFDTLAGGPGDDLLDGEGGGDGIEYAASATAVQVDLAANVVSGEGRDTLASISEAYGSAFDDTLLGTAGADVLFGAGGADDLDGRAGDDTLTGASGPDVLRGGSGRDVLDGGAAGDQLLAVDGEVDTLRCGAEANVVEADAADQRAADCARRLVIDTTPPQIAARMAGTARIEVRTSERSSLVLRVARRSGRRWTTTATLRRTVARGSTRIALRPLAKRSSQRSYRVMVQARDAAGNRSSTVTVVARAARAARAAI
jgi:hypothetical protein